MNRPPDLHWSEALILLEMRREPQRACGATELARRLGVKPKQLWMGFVRLQARGYAEQVKARGPWRVRWERVQIPHRAAMLPLLEDPDAPDDVPLYAGEPGRWARLISRIIAHIPGASIAED